MRLRIHAIACALWFGVLPWWIYEAHPHYTCGYLAHLQLNLGYAWLWFTGRETEEDREFERTVNARPNWIRGIGRAPLVEDKRIDVPGAASSYIFPGETRP